MVGRLDLDRDGLLAPKTEQLNFCFDFCQGRVEGGSQLYTESEQFITYARSYLLIKIMLNSL